MTWPTNVREQLYGAPYWITQIDKKHIKFELLSTEGTQILPIDLTINKLKPIEKTKDIQQNPTIHKELKGTKKEIPFIKQPTYVSFNVHGEPDKLHGRPHLPFMRVSVEINELAKVLGVNKADIKKAVKAKGNALDALITQQLALKFPEKSDERKVEEESSSHGESRFIYRKSIQHRKEPEEEGRLSIINEEGESSDESGTDWKQMKKFGRGLEKKSEQVSDSTDSVELHPIKLVKKAEVAEKLKIIPPTWDTGLSDEDLSEIKAFYEENIEKLSELEEPIWLSRDEYNLPCSVVYCPDEGPYKGLHVLLKTHTGLDELGIGSYNLTTFVLHMDTGGQTAFRTGREEDVTENELEVNHILSDDPERYNAYKYVYYVSKSYRPRRGRRANEPKGHIPKQKGVGKIGFICEYMPMTLQKRLDNGPPLDDIEKNQFSLAYGKLIENLVVRGIVHNDQKGENVNMDPKGKVKLSDFGMAVKVGDQRTCCGTRGYTAPELRDIGDRGKAIGKVLSIEANPAADVWGMGCVFLDIIGSKMADEYLQKHDLAGRLIENLQYDVFEGPGGAKDQYLSERNNPNHIHYIIDKCLSLDPKDRPTAAEVVAFLKKITPDAGPY